MKVPTCSLYVLMVLGSGCLSNEELLMREKLAQIQPGMHRDDISRVLGVWGRRHFWKTERSRVPDGRTEDRQREFEIKKASNFALLVPTNLLEFIPLTGGATEVEHYVFNKRRKFAVGYWFSDLLLFYEARTGILLGYGYMPLRVAGRSDLDGMEFFFQGAIRAP